MMRRWLLSLAAVVLAPGVFAQTITSLSPSSATAGSGPVTLTINGQFGVGDAVGTNVIWYPPGANSQPSALAVSSITVTQVVATIPASLLTTPETAQVAVSQGVSEAAMQLSNLVPFTVTAPPATIAGITPNSAVAGSAGFTLTVGGTNFPSISSPASSGFALTWNGSALPTTIVNSQELTATVSASLIATPGTASISLNTQPAPTPVTFTILAPLTLKDISPTSATAGGAAFTLTANGTGFSSGTVVTWNGSPLATTFGNAQLITAAVPAGLIATAGTASVNVANGSQTTTTPITFTINPALTLTSISPTSATAGGPSFTITANGTGFVAGDSIDWNGAPLSTTFINSGQATALVPANLIAQAGTASITVVSSAKASNALPFTISPPALTLSSISPNTATSGGPAFTLTANGSGFSSGTQVTWNGSALTTIFVSATQMTASVPAALIATAGTAAVGVAATGQSSPPTLPFTITQALTLTGISPNTAISGSPAFTLTASGAGFVNGATITWNGSPLSTTFVSATQLTASVPATLIATAGTASVGVAEANQTSPSPLPFTIIQALTLTSISPNTAIAGGAAFTLTANGSGFNSSTQVTWNGSPLTTTFVSTGQLMAAVPASLITTAGTASVSVAASNQTSPAPLPFTITQAITLTSLSPSSIAPGGASFPLTVTGTGFTSNTAVFWNGLALPSTVTNSTTMTATVPASLIAQVGAATITAQSGTVVSNALTFSITGQGLTLISLSPASAAVGSAQLSLTVNGSGFLPPSTSGTTLVAGTTVTWNGSALATQFVSSVQLIATVPASLLTAPGTATVSLTGSPTPASLPFTITSPLTLTSISPSTVASGGPGFTLTANGAGFLAATVVTWNGSPIATTFVSAGQLTAAVPASFITSPSMASIDVSAGTGQTPPAPLTLTITQGINLTSLSPASATAGGPAFTLTVNGNGFTPSAIVNWNSTPLATTFVSATVLTASVSASLIAQAGTATVTASNGTLVSNSLPFTISPPTPTITSLSQTTAPTGGAAFTLTITGTGFLPTSTVTWNAISLAPTYVSATQLTAAVTAQLLSAPGTAAIVVHNGALASNAVTLTVTPPGPVITSISPASVLAGGATFTLTVNGTGFVANAVVSLNSTALSSTFVSGTQVTAVVPASLITQPGTAQITLTNPSGPASNAVTLTIAAPTPAITSIAPASVTAGGAAFTLTVNGTGFLSGATVSLNGTALTTTFVSGTQLTAAIPSSLITQAGTAQITAANSGGAASNAVTLTITAMAPTITSISPPSVAVGGPAFTLTVNGTGFVNGATVSLNGAALPTTFVSATQLTAAVPASSIAQAGTPQVTVANPGGTASNAVSLTITAAAPTLTSISPATVTEGGPAFTLTINGTGFVNGATASLGTNTLTTTFVSATQLTAAVPASLIAQPGPSPVTVTNPGTAASNPLPLTVNPPVPTITSISPASVTAGMPAFTLTVNGTNFLTGAVAFLNGNSLNTTFVSATQITAQVPANLIAQVGTASITAANMGGTQSSAVTLTIAAAGPMLTSLSPTSANVGDPGFTLAVNGTGFIQGSVVQWNGTALPTTLVSATQLTGTVGAAMLTAPGTASVTVVNPVPGGSPVTSNALTFTINAVTPTISSISPTSATAGAASVTLTVNGTGFLSLTNILWNTTTLTTQFLSATQVTASVPANLLAQAGTASITAVNPGNAVSNAVTFTINPPAPAAITSLSQTSATAGSGAFTLTVTGTGFNSSAVVNFGPTALATTFVSATQITAAVPANLLLTPNTTVQVTVTQAGTTSSGVSFAIGLPTAPSLTLAPPANVGPAQQPTIGFTLNAPYPLALSGTATLSFVSNATVPIVDPAIQFAGGGTTMNFNVAANSTTLPALQIQTGTVAGTITVTIALTAAGVTVTPASGATATIVIPKSAPVITTGKLTLIRQSGYLEVDMDGFSTTRDMTQAVFQLNAAPGGSFTTSTFTVPLSAPFTTWYQSAASTAFGSQFSYAQSFSVIGSTSEIQSVTVTLTNSAGSSVSATTN